MVEAPWGNLNDGHRCFIRKLINAIHDKVEIYTDHTCQQKADPSVLLAILDTFQRIDPTTYELKTVVVNNCYFYLDVHLFKTYQVAYYQPKTGKWGVRTLAIAPLMAKTTIEGAYLYRKPLFWIKVKNQGEDINSKNISWAARTHSRSAKSYLNLKNVEVIKRQNGIEPIADFFSQIKNNVLTPLYDNGYGWNREQLTKEQVNALVTDTDTIRFIDPATYGTVKKAVHNNIELDKIQNLNLVQEWFWDKKEKTLSVRLVAIAPTLTVTNEKGGFQYLKPLFYQRFD
jgi:hypothetical protein